jgi:hypothetical protein
MAMPSTPRASSTPTTGSRSASARSGASFTTIGRLGLPAAINCERAASARASKIVQGRRGLQVAQARRIGRGDVDGKVAGDVIEVLDTLDVVGRAVGRILVGPELMPTTPRGGRASSRASCRGVTAVVEAEPIDDRAVLAEPEDARARIALLWSRRDGADLGEAEPHGQHGPQPRARPCRSPRRCRAGWETTSPHTFAASRPSSVAELRG